jgi:hypothetical protein
MFRSVSLAFLLMVSTVCTARPFELLPAGETAVGDLKIDVAPGWNAGTADPKLLFPAAIWTRDGPLLDRIVVYAGIGDNQPIMNDRKSVKLPRFHKGMASHEWMSVIVSTLTSMFGDDPARVETTNVRPYEFGGHAGILFEVEVTPVEIAYYKGMVAGFVVDQKLYLVMYFGADPYYYDKHLEAAQQMIASARL